MFWGAEVQFDKKFTPVKEDYAYLHLRNVSVLWAKEKLSVVCTIKKQTETEEEEDIVLCHLDNLTNKNSKLNLYFDLTNQDISFSVIGKGKVCLVGSLEAKEGKALTNELVKNLAPQIQDAKKKMLLDLFQLTQETKQKGDHNDEDEDDEDLDDEEEYQEGMELEDDDDDDEEEDEDDDEEEQKQEKKPISILKHNISKPALKDNNKKGPIKNDKKQEQNQKVNQKNIKIVKKENVSQKEQNQKNAGQNGKQNKQVQFKLTSTFKPKKDEEVEVDEFSAL